VKSRADQILSHQMYFYTSQLRFSPYQKPLFSTYTVLMGSTSLRARSPHGPDLPARSQSSRRCSPHELHVPRGSTSMRARSPHGTAVLMGATSLRPPKPQGLRLPRAIDGTPITRPHLLFQFVTSSHSITDCSGIGFLYCTTSRYSRYATSCCGAGYPHYIALWDQPLWLEA
jgi:hypothetical protein